MSKKSKHPRYDDPSAFKQQFPLIRETQEQFYSPLANITTVKYYTMGKCKIVIHEADAQQGWFMSVQRGDRYPAWDEIVWLRYNLIPDAAIMSLLLPNLNHYINQEDTDYRNVFTMEQKGWAIDPMPQHCERDMVMQPGTQTNLNAVLECPTCGETLSVNFSTWNEEHGNGFKGKRAEVSK